MKERPILMNAESVKAILGGRKTQTRRAVKPRWVCPYGVIGDGLWVRETWKRDDVDGDIYYKADYSPELLKECCFDQDEERWCSPIYMPRHVSRILLEITDLRCERVQDISAEDCRAEGITDTGGRTKDVSVEAWIHAGFSVLWDDINGKKHPWDSNPWVWVITFKVVERPT